MTPDPVEPVLLAVVLSELESTLIVDALRDRGIEAESSGGLTAGFRAEAPGSVRILVHQGDFARARAALNDFKSERSEIDWSQVDVGEPE